MRHVPLIQELGQQHARRKGRHGVLFLFDATTAVATDNLLHLE
ncbi:MAG TPA: hypothetical protein VGX76_24990 [Pirellulales bacterium]|jgi:hypothetical protein|nr:hypothetical protein [Pirellulales bacterium]